MPAKYNQTTGRQEARTKSGMPYRTRRAYRFVAPYFWPSKIISTWKGGTSVAQEQDTGARGKRKTRRPSRYECSTRGKRTPRSRPGGAVSIPGRVIDGRTGAAWENAKDQLVCSIQDATRRISKLLGPFNLAPVGTPRIRHCRATSWSRDNQRCSAFVAHGMRSSGPVCYTARPTAGSQLSSHKI